MAVFRAQAGFFHRLNKLGAGAEVSNLFCVDQVKQPAGIRVGRVAVVEHQSSAGVQPADQPVPHHPAAGGEVEQGVGVAHISVQVQLFGLLKQGAASPMDDALGLPGGAGGIENKKRMVEGQAHKVRRRAGGLQPGAPDQCPGNAAAIAAPGHHNQQFRFQGVMQCVYALAQVDPLAVVVVAITGQQHLGFDLPETVQYPGNPEIRGAGRPDCADPGGAQGSDQGLGAVGHKARYPVSGLNASRQQLGGHFAGGHPQLRIADDTAAAIFQYADHGGVGVVAFEQVFRVIEFAVGKPAGVLKVFAGCQHGIAGPADHTAVIPDLLPEGVGLLHRPAMQGLIIR